MLPGIDGETVASRMRNLCGYTSPIMLISASDKVGDVARRVPNARYLRKPFDLDSLSTAVKSDLSARAN
jgi:DNA-binding response OmpR family regulator